MSNNMFITCLKVQQVFYGIVHNMFIAEICKHCNFGNKSNWRRTELWATCASPAVTSPRPLSTFCKTLPIRLQMAAVPIEIHWIFSRKKSTFSSDHLKNLSTRTNHADDPLDARYRGPRLSVAKGCIWTPIRACAKTYGTDRYSAIACHDVMMSWCHELICQGAVQF